MEDLKKLKEKFGVIYTLKTENESGEEVISYLKKPDFKTKQTVFNILRKDPENLFTAGEVLFRACHVGGFDITEDDDAKFAGYISVTEMIEFKPAELKKN